MSDMIDITIGKYLEKSCKGVSKPSGGKIYRQRIYHDIQPI
jgi:hypothetical protein